MRPEPDVKAIWTVHITYSSKQPGATHYASIPEDTLVLPNPDHEPITREQIDPYITRSETHLLTVMKAQHGQLSMDEPDIGHVVAQVRDSDEYQPDDLARMLHNDIAEFTPAPRADAKIYDALLNGIAAHTYLWELEGMRVAVYKESRIIRDIVLKQIRVRGRDTTLSLFSETGDGSLPRIPNVVIARQLAKPNVF